MRHRFKMINKGRDLAQCKGAGLNLQYCKIKTEKSRNIPAISEGATSPEVKEDGDPCCLSSCLVAGPVTSWRPHLCTTPTITKPQGPANCPPPHRTQMTKQRDSALDSL